METAKAPESKRYCTICGAASSAEATFCRSCGRVLEIPRSPLGTIYCERCGGELSLGDSYCPTCGEPQFKGGLVKAEPAPPPAPSTASRPAITDDSVVVDEVRPTPSLWIRILWLLFIGPPIGMVAAVLAWIAVITVIFAPLAIDFLEQLSFLVTLKPRGKRMRLRRQSGGTVAATEEPVDQLPLKTRGTYFAIVGWLIALIWLSIAWGFAWTLIGLPVAMWMADRLPFLTTLDQR